MIVQVDEKQKEEDNLYQSEIFREADEIIETRFVKPVIDSIKKLKEMNATSRKKMQHDMAEAASNMELRTQL